MESRGKERSRRENEVIVEEATAEECLAFGEIGSKRKRVQLLLEAAPVDDQLWSESSLVVVDDREFPIRLFG
jgi:hypothetical protein